jgi:hypothetical protein
MRDSKEINHAAKVTLVVVVITSLSALLSRFSMNMPISENTASFRASISHFLKFNLVWLIAVIIISLGLCIYIKKTDGKFNLKFLKDPLIRLTSGLLIMFEGITTLISKCTVLILNIQTFQQSATLLGDKADEVINTALGSNVIPLFINLIQILLGLYIVLPQKQSKEL